MSNLASRCFFLLALSLVGACSEPSSITPPVKTSPTAPIALNPTPIPTPTVKPLNDTVTVGWLEYCYILPGKHKIKGKMDTGALTSSLGTESLEIFKRDGKEFIRFSYYNSSDVLVTEELPKTGESRIKERIGSPTVRPVVCMPIHLGNIVVNTEINLVNREKFIYPLLLGRKFLAEAKLLVDVRNKYLLSPNTSKTNSKNATITQPQPEPTP